MKVALNDLSRASLEFIEPMLAKNVERLPTKGDWVYEVKLDGYRAQAMKTRASLLVIISVLTNAWSNSIKLAKELT